MLECGFESRLGLEISGSSETLSEGHRQWFSLGTPVSSPSSSVNGFSQLNKAKINSVRLNS